MKPGDILLFKAEKDFMSKLIAWGTNSRYSHVAICVSEADITSPGDISKSRIIELVKEK